MSQPLQSGLYGVKITGQKFGESSNKGTPEFCLSFNVYTRRNQGVHEKDPNAWTGIEPVASIMRLYFSEKAAGTSIKKLKKIGFVFTQPRFEFLDEDTLGFVNMIGQEVILECKIEMYQDKPQVRWEVPFSSSYKPCDQDKLDDLNAQFGQNLLDDGSMDAPTEKPSGRIQEENPSTSNDGLPEGF